ncbi:hypothetical protein VNI00_016603 [Paramarasmius palmivorus]|uniref:Hydrophobin n=1 Tax=Paramarasmius palmivorus TaxID=297713 RepID=A0AAW0BD92_9AGAR
MFNISKVILYIFFTLSVLAVATPFPNGGGGGGEHPPATTTVTVTAPGPTETAVNQCNTGDVQCCNTVETAGSPAAAGLLGFLGVVVQDLSVLVGITCTPVTILGIGQGECSARPVCCSNNNFNGLIAIGCVPISIL